MPSKGLETYEELIRGRIQESVAMKQALSDQLGTLARVAEALVRAYRQGNKMILFGNGGSAADAQHIAAELVGRFYLERPSLAAEALTVNTSSLTAIGNDYAFDTVFARQLEGLGRPGDVAVGISTSGKSENVIRALRVARERGMVTVVLTGQDGGRLEKAVDYCICVPSRDVARIQEGHILVGHILCEIIERELFA